MSVSESVLIPPLIESIEARGRKPSAAVEAAAVVWRGSVRPFYEEATAAAAADGRTVARKRPCWW